MTIPTGLVKPIYYYFLECIVFYSIEQSCEFYIQFFLRTYLKMNLFRIKLLLQILFMNYSFYILIPKWIFYFYVFEILNFSYR